MNQSVSPDERVLWKANSTRCDWRKGMPLQRLISAAARLGLIGRPTRITAELADEDCQRLLAQPIDQLAAAMLAAPVPGRAQELTMGGDDPAPWELFWNVYPFDAGRGSVDGLNTLWLTFARSRIVTRQQSDALLDAFLTITSAADTEYAVLHPYEHWRDFDDQHYQIPVTINLMFRGVFWANFLGPGHIEQFDPARLQSLQADRVQWIDDRGLFVVAVPELAEADAPVVEPLLLALTQRFRDALK